ncbi:MAG: archease [Candidatus Nitrosotenuis sp.]
MSYRYLEHATDAFIEVRAPTLEEAFVVAANSVIETILDMGAVEEKKTRSLQVAGKDLNYLLYNWLEELIILTITEGFATGSVKLRIEKNSEYTIFADLSGEDIDVKKHHFKVEIKAPTFHLMEINRDGQVLMRYLLDL